MAQFTFLELHFEAGSIPSVEVPGVAGSSETDSDGDDEGCGSGGLCPGKLLVGAVVFAVLFVVLRKLLGGEDDLDADIEIDTA